MAKTMWFDYSVGRTPGLTTSSANIIGDLFEAGEITEYTVVKIVGGITAWSDTIASAEEFGVGICVLSDGVDAGEEPNPIVGSTIDGASFATQDTQGFWMRKFRRYFTDHMDNYVYDTETFEIDTRRVVREGENLKLVDHASGEANASYYIWMRILILVD